jgi:hypothetical protein
MIIFLQTYSASKRKKYFRKVRRGRILIKDIPGKAMSLVDMNSLWNEQNTNKKTNLYERLECEYWLYVVREGL